MSSGFAFDFPSSSATADALLSARTASCGYQWRTFASGFASSLTVKYLDDNDPSVSSFVRPKAFAATGSQQMNYLPVANSSRILRAQYRRGLVNIAASAKGFIGAGFVDADGNGYFGGFANDATPQATYCLVRVDNGSAAIAPLALWGSRTPYTSAAAYARLCTFEYDRQVAALRFFFDGMQVASATDATYTPTMPALMAHDLGLAAPVDYLLDAVFSYDGASAASTSAVTWRAVGSNDWIGEATINFATDPTYTLRTETLLAAGYARARTVALSAYDANAAVTATVDGTTITVPAGAELQIPAPARDQFTVAGTSGVLRVRMFTGAYVQYQRN